MTANQASAVAQQFNLGTMDQVAFIVRNMDQALPAYEALFGKFHVMALPPMKAKYRGKDISVQLKLAFAKAGSLEIEVIEAVGGAPPYSEHLERHGEGLHHIRFKVQRLQDTLQAMEAAGFVNVYSGDAGTVRFAYVEAPAKLGHTLLELVEGLPGATTS
jgi:catechol 2,3-dioxygenase-like lactoylglutathione lyase family enzyme